MRRRDMLGAAAAVAVVRPAAAAAAQWKMHLIWVPSRPETVSFREFAERANTRSDGTLNITVYDSGSLGIRDVDMLRVLPSGATIQAAGLNPAYLARDVPELPYALPVGVLSSADDQLKLVDVLLRIYGDIYSRNGIRLLGLVIAPVRKTHVMSKEPINTLAGLRSKKLRVWGKFQVDTFARLGISAQIVPQGDMYLALQTGVIDAAIYTLSSAKTISLQEVTKYASYLHPYSEAPGTMIVSERSFAALPAQGKEALIEAGRWITERTAQQLREATTLETQAEEEMRAAGMTILPDFPQADQDTYMQAAREVWRQSSQSLGARGLANYQAVNAALG